MVQPTTSSDGINNNNMPNLENQNQNYKNTAPNQNSFQQMQQQSAFNRRKNFFERKRLLNYQAHNPMDFQNKTYNKDSQQSNNSSSPGQPDQNQNTGGGGSPLGVGAQRAYQQENIDSSNFAFNGPTTSTTTTTFQSGGGKKGQLAPLQTKSGRNPNLMGNKKKGIPAASAAHDRVAIDAPQKQIG